MSDEMTDSDGGTAGPPNLFRACESGIESIKALREYGRAIRGDWSDIDGRDVRDVLDSLADAIEGSDDRSILQWRDWLDLCPSGEGHWTRHCHPVKTIGEGGGAYTYGCGNEPSEW